MPRIKHFQMPTVSKITFRSSSITNSFVNAVIPVIHPTVAEVEQALEILGMSADNVRCSYCGDPSTEWDHLRPLVTGQKPTGFISEIANLVPSCGKCNQSKGKNAWREWIVSSAPRSPKSRGVPDLEAKISRLAAYERYWSPTQLDFAKIAGNELWDQHEENRKDILARMKESQKLADIIRAKINLFHQKLSNMQ